MYLKSVEIHGFKSFANRIVLEFESGITGIVGPNGSGKSNVADAVRWVLGEQSAKQLRGAKMEDVIFAGTTVRRPQGFAFVALTLDNRDHNLPVEYDEVTVSRRVYRSGESEYRINGTNCRLKDVQDLFLDTGIGKEGYSIIGQGQIEKILSGRPEERRELFDEAAGITKFKHRKSEAVRNLANEHDNLNRVNDIIEELEREKAPLASQSETAEKYLKYRDKLKEYETEYFIDNYDRTEEQKEKAEKDREIAKADLSDAENEYDDIKREYESLEEKLKTVEARLSAADDTISTMKLKKSELAGKIDIAREQINSAKSLHEHFGERIKEITDKKDGLIYERSENEKKKEKLDALKKEAESDTYALNEALEKKRDELKALTGQKADIEKRFRSFEKEKAEAAGRIDFYNSVLEQNRIKKLEITNRMLRITEQGETFAASKKDALASIDVLKSRIEKARENIKASEEALKNSEQAKADLERKYREAQNEYFREKTRLEALTNQAERYNGYGGTVRSVMEHAKAEPGILGTVADIIHTEKKYETAVETALGGSIQNIVTDHEETAKRTITWLKSEKLGRATFLPLDSVGVHSPGNFGGALSESGIIGTVAGLVTYEQRFAAIAAHLLGRTLVAENMDTATKIARKYHYSLRIVTLDGEQLNPGGSISGGAFKNSANLLGRNREIEELSVNVNKLESNLASLADDVKKAGADVFSRRSKLGAYSEEMNKLSVEEQTKKNALSQIEERISENESSLAEIKLDLTNSEKEKTDTQTSLAALNDRLTNGNDVPKGDRDSVLHKIDHDIEIKNGEIRETEENISQKKLLEAKIGEQIHFNEKEHERLEGEIRLAEDEERKFSESNSAYTEDMRQKNEYIASVSEDIKKNDDEIKEKEAEREKLSEKKNEITESHRKFFTRREEVSDRKGKLDAEIVRLTSQIEKAEEDMQGMVDYMSETYNLTYSEIVKNMPPKEEGDEEKLSSFAMKKLITNQKNLIRGLGPVNVNAIEEYKELSERYELMSSQQQDIIKAEDSLKQIIDDLDTKMRTQFSEQFAEINREFDEVFKELFGGGRGRLELVEDEDILEAGIKISAQPPGKKLQNMMQLSGGEKSLTAIALLFAIQNLKPSPFCILDEIEAALDDSNVVRFAGYLHKLTDHTQFIVITHRRGTMNAADRLYGITMQEKGVSTMVSVDLIAPELTG